MGSGVLTRGSAARPSASGGVAGPVTSPASVALDGLREGTPARSRAASPAHTDATSARQSTAPRARSASHARSSSSAS